MPGAVRPVVTVGVSVPGNEIFCGKYFRARREWLPNIDLQLSAPAAAFAVVHKCVNGDFIDGAGTVTGSLRQHYGLHMLRRL